jgi:hypothetical protein
MPFLRLIRADLLKLRRRRGMLALALLLTSGASLLLYGVMALQHAGSPLHHGPAGGLDHYRNAVVLLTMMASVVGVIVGSTAGAADIETGVFRDLAATGRARSALFFARLGGGWAVVLPIVALSAAIADVCAVVLAGSLAAPSASALVSGTVAILLSAALGAAAVIGLAALVGSRGPVIGIALAFQLGISPILTQVDLLGQAREAIPLQALSRIGDVGGTMALATALLVVVAWGAALLAAGAWKTRTREI